ncbi:MAG: ABC-F family ATP-binding cassette domain-containing protein [Evtepia sp.]
MIEISVNEVTKEFEVGNRILDGLTFQIDSGERVGILGRNGAGKTTLFRILTGEIEPDVGTVAIAQGKRVGLISQIPVYPVGSTVEDVLRTAFESLYAMEREMEQVTLGMSEDQKKLRQYDTLMANYESGGGYDMDIRLGKVCNGLNIPTEMWSKQFADLSGGEKTRINLARLILEDTEILLLDEPTNHLDLNATQWLEEYLAQYKGTVLTISHDRYFLDKVISRAIEFKDGKAEFYQGNYSFYAVEKERRYLEQCKQYEKEQSKLAQLQTAVDQMHLWAFMGNDKLHKRAFSMEKRMERLKTTDRPSKEKRLNISFGEKEFHGDDMLSLKSISKAFGSRMLFHDLDLDVKDGDRIALLGDNGTGKSTLIKLIMGEESPDQGRLKKGPTVTIGYLPQQIHFAHPERNLVDTMLYDCNCSTQEARDRLASFLFRGEDVFKPVSALSGGEQSRLRLCMLMDNQINLLILDEPTNHLDLASREWIESAVEEFEGTLLFVSHDRYFIHRFANRIWNLEDGVISDFLGSYAAYQAMRERVGKIALQPKKPPKDKTKTGKRTGGTKLLKKEIASVEKKLEKMDETLEQLNEEKEASSSDYKSLEDVMEREKRAFAEYEAMMRYWDSLVEQFEKEEAEEAASAEGKVNATETE